MTIEITDDLCNQAEALAAKGMKQSDIALMLGMASSTLYDKKEKFSEFSESIKRGKAKGIDKVINKFFEKACEGDNTCMIFFLKNQAGWTDKQEIVAEVSATEIVRKIVRHDNSTD